MAAFPNKRSSDTDAKLRIILHFVVPPQVSDRISQHGHVAPAALAALSNAQVSQTAVGPAHVAFLLDDGRICRLPFAIVTGKLVQRFQR